MTLPTGWANNVTFADVLDYQGGSQPPKSEFSTEHAAGRLRLLQIRDFASDAKAVFINDNGKWPRCEANDIMIGRYGASVGKILTGKSGAYNVALVKMIFDRSIIHPQFLFHWLHLDAFQGKLASVSRSAQDGFNKEDLAEIPFPLPPLAEQRRIVAKLDKLTARLRRARTDLDHVATMAGRVRSRALAQVFAFGSVPTISLGHALEDVQAGKSLKCDEREPSENELGVVKVSAVSSEVFKASEAKTLPVGYRPPEQHRIRSGDLLLARASGSINLVGRVALVEGDPKNLYLSDKILRLVLRDQLAPWIYWFLRSPQGRTQMVDAASGISMHNVTQSSLANLLVPLPNERDRSRGLSILRTSFARADRLEAEAASARALLDRLEAAILVRAFRGELVPQDPADEPAATLLARIRDAREKARAAAPKSKRGRQARNGLLSIA